MPGEEERAPGKHWRAPVEEEMVRKTALSKARLICTVHLHGITKQVSIG